MNQALETSTRKVILSMLKTQGPLSVHDMSKQLGITEMAVRRHIHSLEKDDLLETKLVRQAMGRPTNVYTLAPLADELFPKKYMQLTIDLLDELLEGEGHEKIDRLFEGRQEKLQSRYEARMQEKSLEQRVAELALIQNENGYMVDWSQVDEGEFVFSEHNCPITQVANVFQQACRCELALFQHLLDANVERTECLAKGGNKCLYIITQNK
ncbi:DeoR family transcriptional regulator [Paenibacillus marchantiophytorum]|uniref:DeoR family transcriptional regulator n=1 Tax=Paenibacillus marchantiophytorum TaxID=1619310 RepID=A0ABQ2BRE4_9BACL|nr:MULTISPECIES: metalloregulator ArsR/SmtB family transcription factor [Paenibacillus]UKS24168.1 transcriptional regulator [Paenibacillus sp. HWE-109]GGI45753.1 DeoR family transcriptional regulator [Paenibacillus marchantiophytorum]